MQSCNIRFLCFSENFCYCNFMTKKEGKLLAVFIRGRFQQILQIKSKFTYLPCHKVTETPAIFLSKEEM